MIITVGGQPIAGTIGLHIGRVYYSLQIVHDERYSRCSPGTLLEFYEMTALLESRLVDRYEFLGGALQNKLRWTSDAVATTCVRARQSDLRTRLLDTYEYRAKPFAKRWLNRFGLFHFTPQTRAAAGGPK
jgi:CelD/BcsL family acetyltransferase involved in cellulose biosynthesis